MAGQEKLDISEYKGMWLFAIFDLPVMTPADRKNYTQFRKALIQDGFMMMQYSVYARYCASEDSSNVHRRRVRVALPPKGHVRILSITDKQFGKMEVFLGKKKARTDEPPPQMELF